MFLKNRTRANFFFFLGLCSDHESYKDGLIFGEHTGLDFVHILMHKESLKSVLKKHLFQMM